MKNLIGLSGAQGCGKTYLRDNFMQKYPNAMKYDLSTLSRSVQAQLGYSNLNMAVESPDKICIFQDAVLDALIKRDSQYLDEDCGLVLLDRSPLDLAAYATMWVSKIVTPLNSTVTDAGLLVLSDWLYKYIHKCNAASANYATIAVITRSPNIPFKEEDSRAAAADIQPYEQLLLSLAKIWSRPNDIYDVPLIPCAVLDSSIWQIEDRIESLANLIKHVHSKQVWD